MAILTRGQFASIAQNKAGSRGLRGIVNEDRIFSKSTLENMILNKFYI